MTKHQMEITVGQTNSGWFFFEIIEGDRLVARVVNFDSAALARAAADEQIEAIISSAEFPVRQQIEALTGKEVSVIRHIGRLSVSHIASFIDTDGSEVGFHDDTPQQALNGLLDAVRATLTEQAAA